MRTEVVEIRIDARKTATCLLAAVLFLAVAHVGASVLRYELDITHAWGLVDTFDLNFENNVPTFFATMLLVTCATLLAVVALKPPGEGGDGIYWKSLALLFLFLALDEDASLHELLIDPVREVLPVSGPLFFAWIIPYGLAVLVIGLLYFRFVLALQARTRSLFIVAGGLYVAGALGFELLGGWYMSRHDELEDLPYSFLVAGEEVLEMTGLVAFIYALLDFLAAPDRPHAVCVSVVSP
jgi:hypothetical protein